MNSRDARATILSIVLFTVVLGLAPRAAADSFQTLVLSSNQPNPTTCAAPFPAQATFSAAGGNIYEYFVINSMKSGDTVSVRWINPYSQVAMTSTWYSVSAPGSYCWRGAYLSPTQYSWEPGTWNIQIEVNGQFLYQTSFTIITQQQWNQTIINTGLNGPMPALSKIPPYPGGLILYHSGLDCKLWIQQSVIPSASNGVVKIPISISNYQWQAGQPNIVPMVTYNGVGAQPNVLALQPGWILQLNRTNGGPHTAIVLEIVGSYIYFLDSNWVGGAGYGYVGIHYMTQSEFYANFAQFTAYEITLP